MRRWVALLGAAVVLAGCGETPEPVVNPGDAATSGAIAEYDPTLEPSAAVLSLVPEVADVLEVTDFDQIRLTLGFADLTSESSAADRRAFWLAFETQAAFSSGLLRDPAVERLDISQDDVEWEAHFGDSDNTDEWVLAFDRRVPTDRIARAVRSGTGPLSDAVFDADRGILSSAELPDVAESWAADESLADLVGRQASATYVERGCVPIDDIYGAGTLDQLEGKTASDVAGLRELTSYSVSLGSELVTAQLGQARDDVFDRLHLAEHLPAMKLDFATVFTKGVADPASGRIGYDVDNPRAAADWTQRRMLPFAACDT